MSLLKTAMSLRRSKEEQIIIDCYDTLIMYEKRLLRLRPILEGEKTTDYWLRVSREEVTRKENDTEEYEIIKTISDLGYMIMFRLIAIKSTIERMNAPDYVEDSNKPMPTKSFLNDIGNVIFCNVLIRSMMFHVFTRLLKENKFLPLSWEGTVFTTNEYPDTAIAYAKHILDVSPENYLEKTLHANKNISFVLNLLWYSCMLTR